MARVCFPKIEWWVRNEMAEQNGKLWKLGDSCSRSMIDSFISRGVETFSSEVNECFDLSQLDEDATLEILANTGFFLTSCYCHGIAWHDSRLARLVAILKAASVKIGHPPRDSFYTYVTWNSVGPNGRFRSFSAFEEEQNFIRLAQKAQCEYETVAMCLRGLNLFDDTALDQLVEAGMALKRYSSVLRMFLIDSDTRLPAVQPEFFRFFFRDFFPQIEIYGQNWGPPTAANSVPILETDYLIGFPNQWYNDHIRERIRYFVPGDKVRLSAAMEEEGILSRMFSCVCPTWDSTHKRAQLERAYGGEVLRALYEVCSTIGDAAGLHYGLVINYLVKPIKGDIGSAHTGRPSSPWCPIPKGEIEVRRSDLSRGASGMEFDLVKDIRDMRRLHPQVLELKLLLS